ncbi:hypothetical protein REPUB_Repub05bG0061300 [Reevesia pubescens]
MLKSMKPVGYLKPDRVLQVFAIDGFIDSCPKTPNPNLLCKESEQEKIVEEQLEIIDVAELMKDLHEDDEEEMDLNDEVVDKENIRPAMKENMDEVAENENMKSEAGNVKENIKMSENERKARIEEDSLEKSENTEPPHKTRRIIDEDGDLLLGFEDKCPSGGDGSVILYTTTLKGIRKTFEDCNSLRFMLETFGVIFYERDISMHTEYKEELWRILDGKLMPPRLFIKGRYIGGAEQVLTLHEQGKLKVLFQGIPVDTFNGPCEGCAGVRFVLCFKCNGGHRIIADDGLSTECLQCNENGLIICPFCC